MYIRTSYYILMLLTDYCTNLTSYIFCMQTGRRCCHDDDNVFSLLLFTILYHVTITTNYILVSVSSMIYQSSFLICDSIMR